MVSLFPHPASFRFHLAMDTLAFGYILPTTGRIRVFHPLETCAARRTILKRESDSDSLLRYIITNIPKPVEHSSADAIPTAISQYHNHHHPP